MTAEGKWISVEEDTFGADWQTQIEPWVKRFNQINDGSAVGPLHAFKQMYEEGCNQETLDYMENSLGLKNNWWDFMLGTFQEVLVFATEGGFCKATAIKEFGKIQRNGKIAIEIREGDSLIKSVVGARMTLDSVEIEERLSDAKQIDEDFNLDITKSINSMIDEFSDFCFLATANGLAVKYPVHDLKSRGRASKGIKGIALKKEDKVVGFDVVTNDDDIVLVTEKGFGKRVKVSDFRNMRRGAVGVKCLNTSHKTGRVVAAMTVRNKTDELMFLTNGGQMIRLSSMNIPVYKRQAKGVSLMKIKEEDKLISGVVIDGKI